MNRRIKHKRLWIWIPVALVVLAVSGFAVQRSVTVRTSWKVLPYQTLRLNDSREEVMSVAFDLPDPTPLDYARGYVEIDHAVRLHVVSNTPWKIQVWMRDSVIDSSADMQLRSYGAEYFALSSQPQILAQGLNGVFEISIDYRMLLGADGKPSPQVPQEIIYTIMSD